MESVVDAQQHEIEIVLDISQQDNMEKEKHIKELETEPETLRGNVKELTSELDALRERMALMDDTTPQLSSRFFASKDFTPGTPIR